MRSFRQKLFEAEQTHERIRADAELWSLRAASVKNRIENFDALLGRAKVGAGISRTNVGTVNTGKDIPTRCRSVIETRHVIL